MTDNALPYPCPPLDPQISSFRLLSFEIQADDSVHGTLQEFPLSRPPSYIALSYTWGSDDVLHEIHVNGGKMTIRGNLWIALHAIWRHQKQLQQDRTAYSIRKAKLGTDHFMHRPTKWVYFWIDAICIDQTNVLERNHQVQRMRQIYEAADFVLAWLGEESDDSPIAMRIISSEYEGRELDDATERAVCGLLTRDYWERAWIVQEFHLARRILIGCGKHFADFDQDVRPSPCMSKLTPMTWGKSALPAYNMITQRSTFHGGVLKRNDQRFSWELIILNFYRQRCADPRDRIFAFLGLVEQTKGVKPLQADYRLSTTELFDEVLTQVVVHNRRGQADIWYLSWYELGIALSTALKLDNGYQQYKIYGSSADRDEAAAFMKNELARLRIVESGGVRRREEK
jgi:hypothetical protein